MQARQNKELIHSLPWAGGCPHIMLAWEDKCHHHNVPPFPELLLVYMMLYVTVHPFGQFGSAVPAVSPSSLLPIPAHWGFRGEGAGEKALCKCCSAVAKTLMCQQHCLTQVQSPAPYRPLWGASAPSPPAQTSTAIALQIRGTVKAQ